jgi:hypothetical protein
MYRRAWDFLPDFTEFRPSDPRVEYILLALGGQPEFNYQWMTPLDECFWSSIVRNGIFLERVRLNKVGTATQVKRAPVKNIDNFRGRLSPKRKRL